MLQFSTISGCVGDGVSTPLVGLGFDVLVVVGFKVVLPLESCPTILTQTQTLDHKPLQSSLTEGFQVASCSRVIPFLERRLVQDVPFSTKSKVTQLFTMSGCVGVGVCIPLVGVLPPGAVFVGPFVTTGSSIASTQ